MIATAKKRGEKFLLTKSDLPTNQLHTYKSYVERVIDGDTLHVVLDLGFGILHREIIRLAKINAPEIATLEGKKSFEALKKALKDAPFLILKTNKTDIYGRFVADVFVAKKGETDPQKTASEGIYLNQLLLDLRVVERF
jgi:endonuclease YncB( thermonuclease family)